MHKQSENQQREDEAGDGSASGGGKHFRERTLRTLKQSLGKLWKRRSVTITEYDPTYKVAYLGNVLTGWAKGEGCVEKPLSTLWRNYTGSAKADVSMKVTVTGSGLKAVTREHGLTEYWSHRLTYCAAPAAFPRVFCWVYRHEGRRLKQELRCHAVLCSKEAVARRMCTQLRARLAQALSEFKRDKVSRQNARLSLANSVYENPSLPRRKILLSTGSHNYRPPLERSKSAPKLMVIEESAEEDEGEDEEEEEDEQDTRLGRIAEEEERYLGDRWRFPLEEAGGAGCSSECGSDEGSNSLHSLSSTSSSNASSSSPLCRHFKSLTELSQPLAEHHSDCTSSAQGSEGGQQQVVDWRPGAEGAADLERLAAALRRSATFPPPTSSSNCAMVSAAAAAAAAVASANGSDIVITVPTGEPGVELDSLSEEEEDGADTGKDVKHEEDNVSDESGYAEIMMDGMGIGANKENYRVPSPAHCVRV